MQLSFFFISLISFFFQFVSCSSLFLLLGNITTGSLNQTKSFTDDSNNDTWSHNGAASYNIPLDIDAHENEKFNSSIPLHSNDNDNTQSTDSRNLHWKHFMTRIFPNFAEGPLLIPPLIQPDPYAIQPVEYHQVLKKKICPTDTTLQNDMCIGTEVAPPLMVCPPRSSMHGEECLTTCPPRIECPNGFQFRDNRCVACNLTPAEMTCTNSEAIIDVEAMSCSVTVQSILVCPAAFSMVEGNCIRHAAIRFECPNGYVLNRERRCSRITTVAASIVCPDGASFDPAKERCIVVEVLPPYCKPPSTFDSTTHSCIREVREVPVPCPLDYQQHGHHACIRTRRIPAELSCPDDFTIDGNAACRKEATVPSKCPPGLFMNVAQPDVCEKLVKEIPVCPPNSEAVAAQPVLKCVTIEEHDSIECCPPGMEILNGVCRRLEVLPPKLSCIECYNVHRSDVSYVCPDDTTFVDDPFLPKCVFRDANNIACKDSVHPQSIPVNCQPSGNVEQQFANLPSECQQIAPPTAVSQCNYPTQTQTVAAQAFCPDGGEIDGSQCVVRQPITPALTCPVGTLDEESKQCIREIVVPVIARCPPGTWRKGNVCVSENVVQPEFICPQGSHSGADGLCVIQEPAFIPPPKIIRQEPFKVCPTAMLISHNECVETEIMSQATTCPPESSTVNGRCIITSPLIHPPPIEKAVRATFVCPDGTRSYTKQCDLIELVDAESVCPFDSVPDSPRHCILTSPAIMPPPKVLTSIAIPICPPGSQQRGTTCVETHEVDPLMHCPADAVLQDGRCISTQPRIAVCPDGMTQNEAECTREFSLPPQIHLEQGCSYTVTSICLDCPRVVDSSCRSFPH